MPTPSLLIVPARFKSGKLYSQIPTSGAGDFTVTRATSATRVNASGFIESVASGIPRLDYFASGGTVGCPAILVEPSAQNLALQSENFALSTSWNTSVAGRTLVTGNVTATLDPYGGNVADLLSDDNTANNTHRMYTVGSISITSGTTYSTSFFVKANTTPWFEIRLMQSNEADAGIVGTVFNLTSGTITSGSGTIQNYGNGWYRCTNIGTSNFTGNGRIFFYIYNSSGTRIYNGTSSNSLYIFGAQLETGSVATSYIPTTTGSVTRNEDVVSVSGAVSGSIGQSEGTLYAEFFVNFNNRNADIFSVDGGSTSDGFFMSIRSFSVVQLIVRTASANALILQRVGAYPTGVNKLAVAYKNGDFAICLNGTTVQTDTSSITMPSVSINRASFGGSILYTLNQQLSIRAVALYTTRLSNAELAALTSP